MDTNNIIRQSVFIFLTVISWVYTAYISEFLSIFLIIISFLFVTYKSSLNYIFYFYFFIIILSDSNINTLSFVKNIKPLISIYFLSISFIFFNKNKLQLINIKYLYPLIFFVILSFLLGESSFVKFQKSVSLICLYLLLPTFIKNIFFGDEIIHIKTFFYLITIFFVFSLILYFIFPDVVILKNRYRGLLGNPNGFGLLSLLSFFSFYYINHVAKNYFSLNEKYLIYTILLSCLMLSESRSCIFSFFTFLIFNLTLRYSLIFAITLSFFSFFLFEVIYSNPINFLIQFNLDSFFRIESFTNASGRYIAWDFLLNKIKSINYLIGNGVGSTEVLFIDNYNVLSRLGHEGNAHNSYLTMWYDISLIGLLSYVFYLLTFAYKSNFIQNTIPFFIGIFIVGYYESWLSASLNPFVVIFIFFLVSIKSIDPFLEKNNEIE